MQLSVTDYLSRLNPAAEEPVVAFFDLDRTLIDGYSLTALAWQQFFNGRIGPRRFCQLSAMFLRFAGKRIGYTEMLRAVVNDISGMDEAELAALGWQAYDRWLRDWIYHEGKVVVDAHRGHGHDVVMVTSATRYQATPVADVLGIEHLCCTELEIIDGKVSGRVTPCYGEGKVHAAEAYLTGVGASLGDAFFYSDSDEDLPLLEMVGNPVVVNGRSRVVEVGQARGWPSLEFADRGFAKTKTEFKQGEA